MRPLLLPCDKITNKMPQCLGQYLDCYWLRNTSVSILDCGCSYTDTRRISELAGLRTAVRLVWTTNKRLREVAYVSCFGAGRMVVFMYLERPRFTRQPPASAPGHNPRMLGVDDCARIANRGVGDGYSNVT